MLIHPIVDSETNNQSELEYNFKETDKAASDRGAKSIPRYIEWL